MHILAFAIACLSILRPANQCQLGINVGPVKPWRRSNDSPSHFMGSAVFFLQIDFKSFGH